MLLETDFCYRRIRWSGSPLYFNLDYKSHLVCQVSTTMSWRGLQTPLTGRQIPLIDRQDGRTDGRTNGRTDGISPHCTGVRPLPGSLPYFH